MSQIGLFCIEMYSLRILHLHKDFGVLGISLCWECGLHFLSY
jgi:hypothetical protein